MSLTTTTNHTQGMLFRGEREVFGEVMDYLTDSEKFNVAVTSKSNGRLYLNVYVKSGMGQLAKIIEKTYQTLPALSRFTFNFSIGDDLGVSELFQAKFAGCDIALKICAKIPKQNVQERKAIENSRIFLGNADLHVRLQEFPEVDENQEPIFNWGIDEKQRVIEPIKELVFDCIKRGEFKLAEKITRHHVPNYQGMYNFEARAYMGIVMAESYAYIGEIDRAVELFNEFKDPIYREYGVERGLVELVRSALRGGQVEGAYLIKEQIPDVTYGVCDDKYDMKFCMLVLATKDQMNLLKKAIPTGNDHMITAYISGIPELIRNALFYQTWLACGRPSEPQFGEKAFLGRNSNIQGEELQQLRQKVFNLVSTSPNMSIYHKKDDDYKYISSIKEAMYKKRCDSVDELLQDSSHQDIVSSLYTGMASASGRWGDLEFAKQLFKTPEQLEVFISRAYDILNDVEREIEHNKINFERSLTPSTFV